jgi:tRNA uracil 4-sulfurtransferase
MPGNILYLIRYSEIALKSEPVRRRWEDRLITNIHEVLPGSRIRKERGRIWVLGDANEERLSKVFGIVSFSRCDHCHLDELKPFILDYCHRREMNEAKTFALRIRRVGNHSFRSQEKTIELADLILDEFPGLGVDLQNPDITIHVEIRHNDCYLYKDSVKGAGGLPLGVEGKLVALISGGIDSPVAAWAMMRRGCKIIPVYVDLFGSESALERARAVTDALRKYQPGLELMVVRDTFLEEAARLLARQDLGRYTCLICKRRMYKVAQTVAEECGAKGIVTGESLGQVASQTLDNLYVLDEVADMPVYRPLIAYDKVDAEKIAREIGTFEPSIMPADSCSVVPYKPSTKAKLDIIKEVEARLSHLGETQG